MLRAWPLVLLLIACKGTPKKDQPDVGNLHGCDRYAELEVHCGDVPGEEIRKTAAETCLDAEHTKTMTHDLSCAEQSTDCAGYRACMDHVDGDACDHFSQMEERCSGANRASMRAACDAARENDPGGAAGRAYMDQSVCAETSSDCDAYRACVLKAMNIAPAH